MNLALESIKLLAILVTPFVVFALAIHWLERLIQTRLAQRFGWRSVLWTGWLGTPIHELSHAFLCRIFHHRIDEIALFEPDQRSGRLGFVRHSFTPGNWYQELGNFFIGVAPLVGGSLVLVILLWMFYPSAVRTAFASAGDIESVGAVQQMIAITSTVVQEILTPRNWLTARFWLFVYFVLCVGGHMAPSPSDYEGASRGVWWVGIGLLVTTIGLALMGIDTRTMIDGMLGLLGPLFAVFALTIVLCGVATALVWVVTLPFPERYRVS